jgi:WD40 repeat protein
MKRSVISPQKKQQQTTISTQNENDGNPKQQQVPTNTPYSKGAVVASLTDDKSRPSYPYSSLALSPNGRYALVAGKGTIELAAVGPEGLRTLRSLKIAHHFASSPSSASPANIHHQQRHGDFRDAFRPAVTAGVANMNMNQQNFGNIIVTKVAWSNNFNYSAYSGLRNTKKKMSQRGSMADTSMDESSRSITHSMDAEIYEPSKQQKGRRKNTRFQDPKSSDDDDGTDRADDFANETMKEDDSLIAAAGSNGIVIVWSAKRLLFSDSGIPPTTKKLGGFNSLTSSSASSAAFLAKKQRTQQPEGILDQHTRAINGMAWHPTISGLLLTASQDGTIKLWQRKALTRPEPNEESGDKKPQEQSPQHQRSWWGGVVGGGSRNDGRGSPTADDDDAIKYAWGCRATYSLGEQDAVRDIRWNVLVPEIFGVVTSNGNLVVYNMNVTIKALVKIAAHTGDASSLDWHPRWPFVVATGGSSDRFVKIWDLESSLESMVNTTKQRRKEASQNRKEAQQQYHHDNSHTYDTCKSDTSSHSASSHESM